MATNIQVRMTDLTQAMESSDDCSLSWYIHRKTGGMILVSEDEPEMMAELEDPLTRAFLKSRKDFLEIDRMSSHKAYEVMEAFVETVEDNAVREQLYGALQGRRPFRGFREALPDTLLDAWYRHRDAALCAYAEAWLRLNLPWAEIIPQ